jgi:hypothetical protein
VIPFGPGWMVGDYYISGVIVNVPISLILIFALGSIGIYGFIVGGWASESKYSLLGSMRTCAQMVSYEVALALSVLGVVLMAGSLSLVDIAVKQQETLWFVLPQFVGFATKVCNDRFLDRRTIAKGSRLGLEFFPKSSKNFSRQAGLINLVDAAHVHGSQNLVNRRQNL